MPAQVEPNVVDQLVRSRRALSGANVPSSPTFLDDRTLLFLGVDASKAGPAVRSSADLHVARLPPVGVVVGLAGPVHVPWTPLLGDDDAAVGASRPPPPRDRPRETAVGVTSFHAHQLSRTLLLPRHGALHLVDGLAAESGRPKARRLTRPRSPAPPSAPASAAANYLDPSFSPDGRMVSFVRGGDLWCLDVASGAERRLTHSESARGADVDGRSQGGAGPEPMRSRTCGQADYTASEEHGRHTGAWWRPCRSPVTGNFQLLYLAVDHSDAPVAHIPTFDARRGPERLHYTKAGTPNCVSEPGVVDVPPPPPPPSDSAALAAWAATDPRNVAGERSWAPTTPLRRQFPAAVAEYVVRAGWLPERGEGPARDGGGGGGDGRFLETDPGVFWLQLLDRRQKSTRFVALPLANGGAAITVASDSSAANRWINVCDSTHWLGSRPALIFASERSGFMHLYIKDLPSLAGRLAARSGGSGEPIGEPSAPVRLAASAPPPNDCASSGSDCSSSVGGDECEAEDAARTVPGTLRRITAGESELWMTEDIVHVDEERELVFFSSTFGGPLERQLCVASFRAGARPTDVHQLTEQGFTHSAFAFHPSGRRFCATFSSRHVPHQSAVYDVAGLSTGTPAAIRIVEVARLANPASKAPFAIQPPEIFDFLADDGRTRLYGALYKPSKVHPTDPDPGRGPHATVLSVYGGPGVQTVRNEWELTMQLKHQLMANHRYAVVMIDGRGSARRGVEFESVFADVGFGAVELRDQVRGIEHLVARGVVDPARVGCSGWSYGAYASCMLLAKYSHLFLFAVCGAAVVRFEEYSAAYSERFLGKPSENPPAYASSSVLSHVQSLPDREGRLMLIHAVLDENVHCAQTLELVSALVKLNKPHSLVLYPKERHGLRAASAQLHFESTFFRFVDNALSRVAT